MAHFSSGHFLFPPNRARQPRAIAAAFAVASIGAGVARAAPPAPPKLHRAPPISNVIDGVTFEASNWPPDLAAGSKGASRGNHRAVVEVDVSVLAARSPVRVTVPWRRHDPKLGWQSQRKRGLLEASEVGRLLRRHR